MATPTLTSASIVTAITEMITSAGAVIIGVLPVVLGLVGLLIGLNFGIRFLVRRVGGTR